MNVSELYDLVHWITDKIETPQILQKYEALHALLQKHAQPNQQKPPFENEKNAVVTALEAVPLDSLSIEQLEFLSEMGIADLVGVEGRKKLEDSLYRNVIDVATSASDVQKIIQSLKNTISKSNQIKAGLAGCVSEEQYESDDEILMRVSFKDGAEMANVVDFKKWGSIWFDIGRGIAMVNDTAPEQIKVVGATRGSIIIELAVVAGIAKTASIIILDALKVVDKVLEIKKKAAEIKSLNLSNDKAEKELEKLAEYEKDEGMKAITTQISNSFNLKPKEDGEKIKVLTNSVNKLVNFIEKGGVVDFVTHEDEATEEQVIPTELRLSFEEIRALEHKIKSIEYKDD